MDQDLITGLDLDIAIEVDVSMEALECVLDFDRAGDVEGPPRPKQGKHHCLLLMKWSNSIWNCCAFCAPYASR